VAADVFAAGIFTVVALVPAMQAGAPVVLATVAMGMGLAVRRWSWPTMVALTSGAGLCQLAAGQLAFVADLGYAAVFFVLGAHPVAPVRRLGLVAAVGTAAVLAAAVGLGVVEVARGLSATAAVVGSAGMALLVAGGGWSAGYARWQSRARISAQVRAGFDQERTRLAADMHDLVAHTWAVVAAQADGARYALESPGDSRAVGNAAHALDVIADTARASIADLRDLLAELGYQQAAVPVARGSRLALVERMRASGMDVRLVGQGSASGSDAFAGVALRLLAESLTNALKHGDLDHPVVVEEDWRDGYRLVVRNRIRPSSPAHGTGHGVAGMRDRVHAAGGTFRAGREDTSWVLCADFQELSA
jgi:signal transduction histidine kinase